MDTETSTSTRQVPPTHYLLRVESHRLLSESKRKYDSPYFEAGGYKWRLSFYRSEDKKFDKYISLYLTICETEILSSGWEVDVDFTLSVYNFIRDSYLTFKGMGRFHENKKEWGFERIESLETFEDLSKGYVVNDSCVFGAEVFVINSTLNSVSVSLFGRGCITSPTFRWEIDEFSKMDKYLLYSQLFSSGGAKWNLQIYPKDYKRKEGKAFSMFLCFVDSGIPNNTSTIYVDCLLRIIDQVNSKHKERSVKRWFSGFGHGLPEMMLLKDLHKSSNGYVVEDTLIVEVEFFLMSRTNVSQS